MINFLSFLYHSPYCPVLPNNRVSSLPGNFRSSGLVLNFFSVLVYVLEYGMLWVLSWKCTEYCVSLFTKYIGKVFLIYQISWSNNNYICLFLVSAQYLFGLLSRLAEIVFILFPSVKGSLSNFASNLSKLINFYSPWN